MANGIFDTLGFMTPAQVQQTLIPVATQGQPIVPTPQPTQGAFGTPDIRPAGNIQSAQLDVPLQPSRHFFGITKEDPRLIARRGLAQNLGEIYPEVKGKYDSSEWWTKYGEELRRNGDLGGAVEALKQASSLRGVEQSKLLEERARKEKIGREEAEIKFSNENTLRDEYQTQSKYYNQAVHGYDTILGAAKHKPGETSGVSDMSLIFAYMKVLDPQSVVREGEYATAQKTAGILPWFGNIYNRVTKGEGLTEAQRKLFVRKSSELMKAHETRQGQLRSEYRTLAERNKLNPDNVLVGLSTSPKVDNKRVFSQQERDWIDRAKLLPQNQGMSEGDIISEGIRLGRIKGE